MPTAPKRKVRRNRRCRPTARAFRVFAPIIGKDPRELHAFQLVDQGEPLPFTSTERETYLRT